MQIKHIEIRNFRNFEHLSVDFHPQLNVFVGVNGSGKTALLEVLKYGVIGLIGEIKGAVPQKTQAASYSLDPKKDPRISIFSLGEWVQSDELTLEYEGIFEASPVRWKRGLQRKNVKYGHLNELKQIRPLADKLSSALQSNTNVELPLFAYYSTGRLFLESKDSGAKINGKRVDGYLNAATAKSSQFLFNEWFERLERGQYQFEKTRIGFDFSFFEQVKNLIRDFIPDCETVFFDTIRFKEVALKFSNGSVLPYSALSDGVRNLVALICDLALRCAVLNPWKGSEINQLHGIVLIDEVDLHLHPSWQRIVVPRLLKAFPNVQFFLTTHSPLVLASLEPYIADAEPNIWLLNENTIAPLDRELIGTANQWLTEVFQIKEPRNIEAEAAMLRAEQLLATDSNDLPALNSVHSSLERFLPSHDKFWVRWNYFYEKKSLRQ